MKYHLLRSRCKSTVGCRKGVGTEMIQQAFRGKNNRIFNCKLGLVDGCGPKAVTWGCVVGNI